MNIENNPPKVSLNYTQWENLNITASSTIFHKKTSEIDFLLDTGSIPTTISHKYINFDSPDLNIIGSQDYTTLDQFNNKSILARATFSIKTQEDYLLSCNNCLFYINNADTTVMGISPGISEDYEGNVLRNVPSIFGLLQDSSMQYKAALLDGNKDKPNIQFYNQSSLLTNFTFYKTDTSSFVTEIMDDTLKIEILINNTPTYTPEYLLLDTGSGENYIYLDKEVEFDKSKFKLCSTTCPTPWFNGCYYYNKSDQFNVTFNDKQIYSFESELPAGSLDQRSWFSCPLEAQKFGTKGACLSTLFFTQNQVAYDYNSKDKMIGLEIKDSS